MLNLSDGYYRTFLIWVKNEEGETVWSDPHFGLVAIKYFNLTLNANSSYTEKFSWDQREHYGSGCEVKEKGFQVSSGKYNVHSNLRLDRNIYGNETLSCGKSFEIQERFLWIVLLTSIIIGSVILLYRRQKKKK